MITYLMLGQHGYLGNQMFQYALLLGISEKNKFTFAIPQNFNSLKDCFNIKCKVYDYPNNAANIVKHLNFYREKYFHFNENIFDMKDNIIYAGNFQSEKYFKHCEQKVREQFTFKENILNNSKIFIDSIKQKNNNKTVVSVHVRRGDYLNHPHAHPVCTIEWYKAAFENFPSNETVFVVFSDDLKWCKDNFSLITTHNIEYSSLSNNFEDLCAMSLCDHNIIANSSFSWWGAWLNNKNEKTVIAPKKWFGPNYYYHQTHDLYCDNWIVL